MLIKVCVCVCVCYGVTLSFSITVHNRKEKTKNKIGRKFELSGSLVIEMKKLLLNILDSKVRVGVRP